MKKLMLVVLFVASSGLADDDEFLVKPIAETEKVSETGVNEKGPVKKAGVIKSELRKCFKCFGKGKQTVTVRESCERCEGKGYIEVEIELKDTVNRAYWDSYRTTRKVMSKKPCPQCGRRGSIPTKKEQNCPRCQGFGYLTKNGKPARMETEVEQQAAEDQEKPMQSDTDVGLSLAARLRMKRAKVGAHDIDMPSGKGWAEFDYMANEGEFTIKGKGTSFVTKWLPMRGGTIMAVKGNNDMIGSKAGQKWIPETVGELESFDWSHSFVRARNGDIVSIMNKEGRMMGVKVVKLSNRDDGDAENLLHIEFVIY